MVVNGTVIASATADKGAMVQAVHSVCRQWVWLPQCPRPMPTVLATRRKPTKASTAKGVLPVHGAWAATAATSTNT